MKSKYKRYKYGKVKPKTEEKMIKLKKQGFSSKFIAEKFNVAEATVNYHTNKHYNLEVKAYGKRKPKDKKSKLKEKEYIKNYINNRYHTDKAFRKRHLKLVKSSMKEKRMERKKKGLCSSCGEKLLSDKFFECEKCRKKSRDNAKRLKERKNKI